MWPAHSCLGHIQSQDMIIILCYLILWEHGGISGLSSMLLCYSSFYVNVSFNKLWCLLYVCGLERSWEGGWWDGILFLDGVMLVCGMWLFFCFFLWNFDWIALCKEKWMKVMFLSKQNVCTWILQNRSWCQLCRIMVSEVFVPGFDSFSAVLGGSCFCTHARSL